MKTNYKLQSAIRLALGAGAAAALSGSPAVLAQEGDVGVDQIEEITVTGSRIKRADLDSASPVTVLDREAIMAQGITDVGNLIQRMPSMAGTPLGTTTNNGNNTEGLVEIDLRGMGPDRTVTLINGKRTVDGGDYQTIPAIMIERVEILKDGASAVYGADAVAGVVNIITRSDFEGVNVDAQTSDFFDVKSGKQSSVSFIAGTAFDEGHFMFGAEYINQEAAYQSDTPWDFLQGSYYIYYDSLRGCEAHPAAPYDGTSAGGCYFFGSSRIPESRLNFVTNGRFLVDQPGAVMTPHDGRTYNYAPVNYLQTPYERTNIFAEGHFDVSDNVRFNATLRSNFRNSDQELAPLPYDSNLDPAYSGTFNGEAYSGVSESNYYLVEAIDRYNAANGTTLPYEPLNNIRRRMVETPRHFSQEVIQYQATFGLEGTLGDFDWDVHYNKGYRSLEANDLGQFSGVRLTNALGPSADLLDAAGNAGQDGVPECYGDVSDPSTLIADCTPLNVFGGAGTVSQEMLDYVAVELVDTRINTQDIFGASVSGSLGNLPGGELGWAAGYEYRGETFKYTPDSAKTLDAVTGGATFGTDGSLYSNSVFVEALAPVYDNGTQSIDLKGGVRYDEYNIFGGDTTWQFGFEFRALDSLKLRATAGTVFRSPTIADLFDGLSDSAPQYVDPCDPANFPTGGSLPAGCARTAFQTDTQTTSRIGGNPNLIPETGDTLTAGFVWTPEIGGNDFSLIVDYWDIAIEDGISSYGVTYILDQCYNKQVASQCALITRRNDADYSIDNIIDTDVNVAEQGAKGIDTEVRFDFDTGFGEFETALLWSHLLERTKTPVPGAAIQHLEGTHTSVTVEDGGTYAEDKFNFSTKWQQGDFSVSYLAEYISAITAEATYIDYPQQIDSSLYHDLVFDYQLSQFGTTRLSLGITNVSNEAPPYIDNAFNASTDPNTYRMFGRGYFFRLSQTFD